MNDVRRGTVLRDKRNERIIIICEVEESTVTYEAGKGVTTGSNGSLENFQNPKLFEVRGYMDPATMPECPPYPRWSEFLE